jgi:hypothetical protein
VSVAEAQQLRTQCQSEGGTWSSQGCAPGDAYLGCTTNQGGFTQTQWTTTPITTAQEKAACPSPGMIVTGGKTIPDAGATGGTGGGGAGGRGTGGFGTGGFGTGGFGTGGFGTGGFGTGGFGTGGFGTGGHGTGGAAGAGTGGAACTGCSVTALAVDANHLVFDGVHKRVYATVGGSASQYPNTVAIIDPATAMVASSVAAGSDPDYLALSDDASMLWVGLDGAAAVRSVDLTVSPPTVGSIHPLPTPSQSISLGTIVGGPMVVLPGAPHSLAVTTLYVGLSPPYVGTYILDDGVARPTYVSTFAGPGLLTGGPSPYLYGFNNEDTGYDFFTLTVDASGVTAKSTGGLLSGFNNTIVYGYERVLAGSGDVIDVSTPAVPARAGRFDFAGSVTPRSATQAVMVSPSTSSGGAATLRVLDLTTFTQTASVVLAPVTDQTIVDVQVVGTDAVAFIGSSSLTTSSGSNRVYVVHATVLASTP